ncbi:MAG: type I-B CRISPR-associated protein Cas5b [Candidatus Micrarchaeia archaeon]
MGESGELFSFIISSDFSAFRKFDTGGDYYLTYYFIPRPTVLGILGSIIGLKKSAKDMLPWWEELKNTKIGVEPLNINLIKHFVAYNNSTGAASQTEKNGGGQTLVIKEQILINPAYRIYVEINEKTEGIFELLKTKKSIFTPYLGKNEFKAQISEVKKHKFVNFEGVSKIDSIYPSFLGEAKNRSTIWLDKGGEIVQIFESHPYTYYNNKYKQFVFVFSSHEIDTKMVTSPIKGEFVRVDDRKVIYLYGG